MLLSHKIELDPNNKQATYFAKACGTARKAYNWALDEWGKQYQAHKADPGLPKPSEGALRRQLNAVKDDLFPWMREVTKCAPQNAIMNLGTAFDNFFRDLKKPKKERRFRYPKQKRKGVHDSFQISNDQFDIDGSRIRIPKLGWVRMRESLRYFGDIQSATVSRVADRWFVSVTTKTEISFLPPESQGAVGVDLGIKTLATLSKADPVPGPKAHKRLMGRLRRAQRSLSRKKKGSKNRGKAKMKVAKLHARIANIREDAAHKLTTMVTRAHSIIGLETLNASGMLKNRKLARSIADASFLEIRRQFEYKAARTGATVVLAERFFPSSKLCSTPGCGFINTELSLKDRHWTCPVCGTRHDRDKNASVNLENMAVAATSASSAADKEAQAFVACGAGSSGDNRKVVVKLPALKQEVSIKPASGRFE